jgi:Tol biopolymer transport system component
MVHLRQHRAGRSDHQRHGSAATAGALTDYGSDSHPTGTDVEDSDDVSNIESSGQNLGELVRNGFTFTTKEVLAVVHEVCRDAAATFPRSADDLWLTDTGELLIARSDSAQEKIDPRAGVSSLLEEMLPPDGDRDPARKVPAPLRGLPARLRAATEDAGPQDRRDLMSILSWHLAGDPRDVMQQLAKRAFRPQPVASTPQPVAAPVPVPAPVRVPVPVDRDELELNPAPTGRPTSAPVQVMPPPRSRGPLATALAILALAFLFIGIGSASYWLFRDDDEEGGEEVAVANDTRPQESEAVVRPDNEVAQQRAPENVMPPATQQDVAPVPAAPVPAPPAPEPAAPQTQAAPQTPAAPQTTDTAAQQAAAPSQPRVIVAPSQGAVPPAQQSQTAQQSQAAQAAKPSPPQLLDVRVGDGAFSPAFASTGRELFFHAGRANGRLLVANLDERMQVRRVTAVRDDGARDYHPRVSPDGRWIAFDSDRDGERGVYVAARDGGQLRRVSGEGYAAVPSWSPDMKWLAFIRGEESRPRVWNLWLRDVATGTMQRHTAHRSGQVWGASWFPDGRAVAYSHEQQLIISPLDGRKKVVVNSPLRGRLVRTPAVSPDGKSVVFQVFRDGAWLYDVQSGSLRRILDDPSAEEFSWSPDGQSIAYHSRRDGAWKIWVLKLPA